MRAIRRMVRRSAALRGLAAAGENLVSAVRPRQVVVPQVPGGPRYLLSAMIRVKDEGRFLPEWIAYHHVLGVEHVYVYDNDSRDGVRDMLRPIIESGILTYTHWPHSPASPGAELDFLATHGGDSGWVAFLDADEFIHERASGDLLRALTTDPRQPAVALNWRYFGSAYHETIPDGLLLENFTRADVGLDHHVKVVARPEQIRRYRTSHNFLYHRGRLARTSEGVAARASFAEPNDGSASLVIHHFVYRSTADYRSKAARGFVDRRGAMDQARRESRIETEFRRHNDTIVDPPFERLDAVRSLLRSWGFDTEYTGA